MNLSIITVNFNNRAGLQRTIDSLICQTWKEYEWIIIDGGSTDGSLELIEQYQHHFTYWCSEPDQGVYHAMNKGVAKANGEYVNFLNSGDIYFDETVLQKINDLHSKADIISGKAVRLDNHKPLYEFDGSLFLQLYETTISHQGAFIKRALLNTYPYDESLKIVSDWKFWLQTIIMDHVGVDITDVVVVKQDMTGISTSQNSRSKELDQHERKKVLDVFFPVLLRKELDNYLSIKRSPLAIYGGFLKIENHTMYTLGWRFLGFLVKLHKITHRFSK